MRERKDGQGSNEECPAPGAGLHTQPYRNESAARPQPRLGAHLLDGFDCGEAVYDDWLKRRELAKQPNSATLTLEVSSGGVIAGRGHHASGEIPMSAQGRHHLDSRRNRLHKLLDPVAGIGLAM